MSVIIDEFNAEITSGHQEGGGEHEAHPENQEQQALIDLLELSQERKSRLAVD